LLQPKKRRRDQSSFSTPTLPQEFEIGESSRKTSLERHEEQIEEILNHLDELSLDRIENMEDNIEGLGKDIQARHQADKESLLDAIYELKINLKGPMPPKRTSTSEAPAMTPAAIRQLVADSVTAALEVQSANTTEIQKMEDEFYHLTVKGNDLKTYTLEEAINIAQRLMDQVTKDTLVQVPSDHKQKFDDRRTFNNNNYRNTNINNRYNNYQPQQNQRQEAVRAYGATPAENNRYNGNSPLCKKCTLRHTGPCTAKCNTCNKVDHLTKNCRNKRLATGSNLLPVTVTCHVYTFYSIELADGSLVSTNVIIQGVTLTLLNQPFKIDLMPIKLSSFVVVIGMDWLSKYHARIICDEKVIRIPINGEALIIQGDQNLPSLPHIRQVEFQIDLILGTAPVARAPYRLALSKMQELSDQLQELADRGSMTYLTNFKVRVSTRRLIYDQKLCEAPILALPEGNNDFFVYCDASHQGLGVNRNSKKSLGRDSKGGINILPPVSIEEHVAVQRETKARTLLLQSLPEDHIADFHYLDDVREIWLAVKARFGGNEESKKMRKTMLKQEFFEFGVSEEEGLHKGYDRFQKILSQLNQMQAKPDNDDVNLKFLRALPPSWSQVALTLKTRGCLEYLSFDDLYNKLRSLEIDVKGGSSYGSRGIVAPTHSAFIGATSTTTKIRYSDPPSHSSLITYTSAHFGSLMKDVLQSFVAENEPIQHMVYEDFEQVDQMDMEELDIKWQMAMLSLQINKFQNKAGRMINFNNKDSARFDRRKARCYNYLQLGHVTRKCNVKKVDEKAWYFAFKISEVKTEEPKAMVSVDSMLNWNEHEAEHKPEEGEQVYGLIAGFKSDFAYPAVNAVGSVYDAAAEFAMMGISPKVQTCPFDCDSKLSKLKKNYAHLETMYNDSFIQVQA
nr:reverse transcriptase domain-containing protein [Tanacetum cinerariifolium]